ncbi:MAG TPA: efflux transporter outer membrane subunit [Bordetella sp.]
MNPTTSAAPPVPCRRPALLLLLTALALTGCTVGPDYVRPAVDAPASYKEQGPWKTAQPGNIDDRQDWWKSYGDSTLDQLMDQANAANLTVQVAMAQYRQARAEDQAARSSFWPQLGLSAGPSRARTNTGGTDGGTKLANAYAIGLDASWEPDLWGEVRRSVEASTATAQASAAQLAAARLSIQAELAQDYLQLRVTDQQKALYARTLAAYTRSLALTRSQYEAGVTLRSDVALADAQLKTTQAQSIDLDAQRNQLEHAIAILIGKPPAEFSLPPADGWRASLPQTPAGVPSQLLERRPDIANAERLAAAANANIGVAQAAYYPSLTLSAGGGFSAPGGGLAQWFSVPNRVWALGASLAETLFDGGLRDAHTDAARAAYDAAVAQYKQTVLGGFQEVEDNLSTLRVLGDENTAQDQAVDASRLAERLALSQYRAGTTTYLTVVTVQAQTLSNERTSSELLGRQLVASVALVKAVGGGWKASQLDGEAAAAQTEQAAADGKRAD